MGHIEELRERYEAVRWELDGVMPDYVSVELEGWASADVAMDAFGREANSLDAVCLIAAYEKAVPSALASQILAALDEGHSWNEVAAALGVSRQAARKRFGPLAG